MTPETATSTIAWASYPFAGQTVLVTGAGSGIGRSIARAFLEQGANVVVTGRNRVFLAETVSGFPHEQYLLVASDVTEAGANEAVVEGVRERFGRLDVLVPNAGSSVPSSIDDPDDSAWNSMRAVNLDSVIRLIRLCVPLLRETTGSIVAVSSIAGLRGDWQQFAYNATKAALNVLVQSLALDLGGDGVRVNAVAPAFTVSRLTQDRLDDEAFRARLLDRVALGRVAVPDDIARAVLFLASGDAAYVTGVILPVDGGTSASSGTPRPAQSA